MWRCDVGDEGLGERDSQSSGSETEEEVGDREREGKEAGRRLDEG